MGNMSKFIRTYLTPQHSAKLKVADIGSQVVAEQTDFLSYKQLFESYQYYGVDVVAGDNVDILLRNPYNWNEIKSNTFDVVVSGQALEHVEYTWVTILEIARILKEGGLCCLVVPSQGYKHSYPLDCWRFFDDGLVALAKWARLEVLDVYTQTDEVEGAIRDPVWQDSVIVMRKPKRSFVSKVKFSLANKACKQMVKNLI